MTFTIDRDQVLSALSVHKKVANKWAKRNTPYVRWLFNRRQITIQSSVGLLINNFGTTFMVSEDVQKYGPIMVDVVSLHKAVKAMPKGVSIVFDITPDDSVEVNLDYATGSKLIMVDEDGLTIKIDCETVVKEEYDIQYESNYLPDFNDWFLLSDDVLYPAMKYASKVRGGIGNPNRRLQNIYWTTHDDSLQMVTSDSFKLLEVNFPHNNVLTSGVQGRTSIGANVVLSSLKPIQMDVLFSYSYRQDQENGDYFLINGEQEGWSYELIDYPYPCIMPDYANSISTEGYNTPSRVHVSDFLKSLVDVSAISKNSCEISIDNTSKQLTVSANVKGIGGVESSSEVVTNSNGSVSVNPNYVIPFLKYVPSEAHLNIFVWDKPKDKFIHPLSMEVEHEETVYWLTVMPLTWE